jgi:hypothetical protein
MPEVFAHGLRKGQSPQDKEVGAARTQVFHQSEFYKTHFLNNPNLERAFDPGRNTLMKRRTQEVGSIPDATLRAMDVAGNAVRARQGRAPTTDPRIGENIPITASPSERKTLYFGGAPIDVGNNPAPSAITATPTPTSSTAVAPVTAKKKQTGSSAAGHGQAQPIKKKKKTGGTSGQRKALLFNQGAEELG